MLSSIHLFLIFEAFQIEKNRRGLIVGQETDKICESRRRPVRMSALFGFVRTG